MWDGGHRLQTGRCSHCTGYPKWLIALEDIRLQLYPPLKTFPKFENHLAKCLLNQQ
jgi:hypothetical protein